MSTAWINYSEPDSMFRNLDIVVIKSTQDAMTAPPTAPPGLVRAVVSGAPLSLENSRSSLLVVRRFAVAGPLSVTPKRSFQKDFALIFSLCLRPSIPYICCFIHNSRLLITSQI